MAALPKRFLVHAASLVLGWMALTAAALATDNYDYGPNEYVTVSKGLSPDKKWAITAHGGGELGYGGFHIFLTDAVSGKKIGPLEEIDGTLDTGAGAFCAIWSEDSSKVAIVYRIDRHEPLQVVSYNIGKGRAFKIKGPVAATKAQEDAWAKYSSDPKPSEKTFGKPKG